MSAKSAGEAISNIFTWIGGGVIAVVVLGYIVSDGSSGGLKLGKLTNNGYAVTFTLANTSDREGDVVFYVSVGDGAIRGCEHIMMMKPGKVDGINFPCDKVSAGKNYNLHVAWADWEDGIAALADRIPVNW